MKKILLIFLFSNLVSFGQEKFQTIYYLNKETIKYSKLKRPKTSLKKIESKKFSELNDIHQKEYLKKSKIDFLNIWEAKIRKKFSSIDSVKITSNQLIGSDKIEFSTKIGINDSVISVMRKKVSDSLDNVRVNIGLEAISFQKMKGTIKFEKNKLYFNPFSVFDTQNNKLTTTDKGIYYLEFKNREYIWLPFREITFTSLTIPLKYRFSNNSTGLKEDFSSAINLNLFFGYSYGNTRFERREKVDNRTKTWKLTSGIIFGTSTVKLDKANTSLSDSPLGADESITKGLVSLGLGTTYSLNNINIGVFYGWDYSIGENSEKWNYNKKPWLGLGIGYSLFKL